jgi:hypothetical protein
LHNDAPETLYNLYISCTVPGRNPFLRDNGGEDTRAHRAREHEALPRVTASLRFAFNGAAPVSVVGRVSSPGEVRPFRFLLPSLSFSRDVTVFMSGTPPQARIRVRAQVPLALLEALRAQDHPGEVLKEEDLTVTLPRRLGLSDVIDRQIRRFREEARRGRRIPMAEVVDLIRLVLRRNDADAVFLAVGRDLGQDLRASGWWHRILPRAMGLRRARRRAVRHVNRLFGARVAETEGPDASIRLRTTEDSGLCEMGLRAVCGILSGTLEQVAAGVRPLSVTVHHGSCRAPGTPPCSWSLELKDA